MKKNKPHFRYCTAWERRGLMFLIVMIISSLGFRWLAYNNQSASCIQLDEHKYAAYLAFANRQQFLKDSMSAYTNRNSYFTNNEFRANTNSYQFKKHSFPGDTGKNKKGNPWQSKNYIAKSDINQADSLDLQSIPGIGAKTANAILQYREQLGGFISLDQLLELNYMDSARWIRLLPYICISDSIVIRKININTASVETLKKHPYIDFYLAKSIVVHRKKETGYRSLEEMKSATKLYQELFDKIKPYLTVE